VTNALFIGVGQSALCWYRCALPARALGADWIGVSGDATALTIQTGQARRDIGGIEDLAAYDVVVLQQPSGQAWLNAIAELQRRGRRVLFEIGDGISEPAERGEPMLRALEAAMRASDGIVCATEQIAERCRSLNSETWVCQNGIDLGRYALTRTPRENVTIGWAGGSGQRPALAPWLGEIAHVLAARPATRFMSVGTEDFASELAERFGAARCLGLPWGPIETYPAAMSSFDIALAPAAPTPLFGGTSDLRWLEAAALGIPTVADAALSTVIADGLTGLLAATPQQAREAILALADDEEMREGIGSAARGHVREHRCIQAVAPQWQRALAGRTRRRPRSLRVSAPRAQVLERPADHEPVRTSVPLT
jgi:glycosyltransferase involved in cell wall biosynthesis